METQLEDTFKAARDNHINTISVTFILYPLPTVPAVTANTNISIDYILAQMAQFTTHPSSSYGSNLSSTIQTHAAAPPYVPIGKKRVAEDLEDHETKRIKTGSGKINSDPYFKPVLDHHCQHDGTYACPESWAANEVQDPASVAPVSPPSQVREIILTDTDVHGNLDFWRWLDDVEDCVDPDLPIPGLPSSLSPETIFAESTEDPFVWRLVNWTEDFVGPVLPISESPSSLLPETILAEAAEDPDVWRLINEIEDFVDPDLPLCESPTDAAEDPDFCHFPIRTLLISSWLNNSHGSALDQRSPSELASLSSALIDREM